MDRGTPSPSRALALVGMPGAGKSLCARHLEAKGYFQYRFGSIIVDEVSRRGWLLTPENERIVREEFRANEGMDAIAKRALPILKQALERQNCIVIDGLYSWSEYKTLSAELGGELTVAAIVSERALRYARLAERTERPLTTAEAEQRDYLEIENLEKGGPIALADYFLINNGAPDDLLRALDSLIERLNFRP
ncbi:MAG TPA: AAA family ATPase [Phototrophicaceae bacterium]|nr:AAA family ATPase [Phototrophicaceae bacterium]